MTAPGSSAGDDPGAELCSGGPAEHPAKSLLENSGCGWLGGAALAGEAAGHDDDHGPVDVGLVVGGQPLVIADGAAVAGDPGQRPLHDPPAGQYLEGVQV